MSRKAIIYFSHPQVQQSQANRQLKRAVASLPGVRVHDLYEMYPDFEIDVAHEQNCLLEADVVVFQHPFYWYSCPPIMKQWMDRVLELGFAYGPGGDSLRGKFWWQVITTGGGSDAYRTEGSNRYTMNEFLRPFEQTASLCGMKYEQPLLVHGARKLSSLELEKASALYLERLSLILNQEGAV